MKRLGIVRIDGGVEKIDYEKYQKLKLALKDFAERHRFTWFNIEFEEKEAFKPD